VIVAKPIPPQEGFYNIDHPELEGVECQVQHGNAAGVTAQGSVAVGVIVGPDCQPRILFQTKHADGASLIAVMTAEDFFVLASCMADASGKAGKIGLAAELGGQA
jgi:hypothetical protein